MTTQHVETLIVGAGPAGLATGRHLQQLGRACLIVDANDRVGDGWRQHDDRLRLDTPRRLCALPGLAFPGEPRSYPSTDELADYLEEYALRLDLPTRLRTRVDRLAARPGGGFTATLDPEAIDCDNVVVATGTVGRPPIFGADGRPAECCGTVAAAPGLYVCGPAFEGASSSMLLQDAGRDAACVAGRIASAARTGERPPPRATGRTARVRPTFAAVAAADQRG
jgi:glycine/D-amino acid oxidase-like deaminating enzyme